MRSKIIRVLPVCVAFISFAGIIISPDPLWAAGLSLNVASGPYNTFVSVTGTAFLSATPFSVNFGTGTTYVQTVGQGVTSSSGGFTIDFWVPNYPGGNYTITAAAGAASATTTFTVTDTIAVDKSSGKVGDTITVSGQGFTQSRNITVYFDNGAAGTTPSDPAGSFTMVIAVPDAFRGAHTLRVADYTGYSTNTLSFTVNPSIAVSPEKASIGGQISVSGKGFTASSPMSFSLDNTNLTSNVNTTASGNFAATSLTIPAISAGSHTLKVTDGSGAAVTSTVSTTNTLSVSPDTGPIGTKVSVQGKGYGNDSRVTITYNGAAVNTDPAVVTADGAGNFTASFLSPSLPAGTYAIAAKDSVNLSSVSFVSSCTFSSSITEGKVGTSVPLSGKGFKAGATISITYDKVPVATATADAIGSFGVSAVVPASRSGNHTILAADGLNSNSISLNISPLIQSSPGSGNVDTDIVFKGFSFVPGATVSVKYGSTQITTASADLDGTFFGSFPAPASKGGNHIITISDGITNLTSTFTMDSAAPSVPSLLGPKADFKADVLAEFKWEPVSDPSGISYSLQVAKDADFSKPFIDKSQIAETAYQLGDTEKLKSASKSNPYYWRVRATDGAFNESAWSKPETFVVGFIMPAWGWYLISAGAAMIIFILGIFAGRMTVRAKR
jgi:hypothetical protein